MNFALYILVLSTYTHAIIAFLKFSLHIILMSNFHIILLLHFLEKILEFSLPISNSSCLCSLELTEVMLSWLVLQRTCSNSQQRPPQKSSPVVNLQPPSSSATQQHCLRCPVPHFWNSFIWLPGQHTFLAFASLDIPRVTQLCVNFCMLEQECCIFGLLFFICPQSLGDLHGLMVISDPHKLITFRFML